MANKIEIKNKKAYHDFEMIEKYTAGIVLTGTEIKSIRGGKASIADAFCFFKERELHIRNMEIAQYSHGGYVNHDSRRDRKLLLQSVELKKIHKKIKERGFTVVATRLFISESGYAKLNIALARGKKEYDKREEIKKRDIRRQTDRSIKL